MKTKKVIVIGIDGATFNLLDPWMKEGSLPNFARIAKEGISCPLISTIPPMTAPAWVSFSTGKNPGKHSVFDFYQIENYQKRVIDGGAVKSKEIWEILSEAGKKVIVVNPPLAYPVKKVNGYLVAGMMTPSCKVNYTYPPELKNRLEKWGYKIGVGLEIGMRSNLARSYVFSKDRKKRQELIDFFNNVERKRVEVIERLSQEIDWNFIFVLFEGTDRLQHYYWNKENQYVIKAHYKAIDSLLDRLLKIGGDDTAVIIMSEHGFGEITKKFYINNFLVWQGLLIPKKSNIFLGWILKKGKEGAAFLSKLGFSPERVLRSSLFFRFYKNLYKPNIDFSKTQAFMLNETSRGIWINLLGREARGTVASQDYEKIRTSIIKELRKLRDPENGERIVEAFKREEIYQGLYTHLAPDILLVTRPDYSLEITIEPETEKLAKNSFLKPTSLGERNADHEMKGMLMIYGSDFQQLKNRFKQPVRIIDLAPTILKLLGTYTPVDIDGRALEEFL